jgi:hypothetical protein
MVNKPYYLKVICIAATVCVVTLPAFSAPKQILLGPPDGGAEQGGQWYFGTNGDAYSYSLIPPTRAAATMISPSATRPPAMRTARIGGRSFSGSDRRRAGPSQ